MLDTKPSGKTQGKKLTRFLGTFFGWNFFSSNPKASTISLILSER